MSESGREPDQELARPEAAGPQRMPLLALAWRFLRFGAVAWGGPVAQIGVLHQELVLRDRWVTDYRFRRVLAVYQALPGPEATELCIWFGTIARGRLGGLVAGLAFLLPGLSLMLLASWLLLDTAWPPGLLAAFAGMQAAVVALVARAAWRLWRTTTTGFPQLRGIAIAALVGSLFGVPFVASLVSGGLIGAVWRTRWHFVAVPIAAVWITLAIYAGLHLETLAPPQLDAAAGPAPTWSALFGSGLRAGTLTFGGAYTAIPFLQADATGAHGWMTLREFLDGLAVGGVLPAPLVIFGTWVGFAGGGLPGALLLTLGIFLPAFTFPILLHNGLERLVANARIHGFLDGIAAAVLGLIAAVAVQLATTLTSWPRAAVAAIALLVLLRMRSRWTVLLVMAAAALAGRLFC